MKCKRILISTVIILFMVTNSCKKTESSSTSLTGTLKGIVSLRDDFGTDIADKSGTTVSIDGSVPPFNAITDFDGNYQIDLLPTGKYDISFSNPGFADRKIIDYVFVGGLYPQIISIPLSKISTTLVTDLAVNIYSSTLIKINCTVSPVIPSYNQRVIRLFLSNNSSVTSTDYLKIDYLYTNTQTSTVSSYAITIDKLIFPSGTNLYVKAYGESFYFYYSTDPVTGLKTFLTMNPTGSNVASIVVP